MEESESSAGSVGSDIMSADQPSHTDCGESMQHGSSALQVQDSESSAGSVGGDGMSNDQPSHTDGDESTQHGSTALLIQTDEEENVAATELGDFLLEAPHADSEEDEVDDIEDYLL